jgi:hypothetical protein
MLHLVASRARHTSSNAFWPSIAILTLQPSAKYSQKEINGVEEEDEFLLISYEAP